MDKVNILLVDDQPAKLLSYEVILAELGENLIKATSPHEALGVLLKTDVAVVLIDVVMPQIDGFQLATMIREHPADPAGRRCQFAVTQALPAGHHSGRIRSLARPA